ncbi:MAG TPA: bifunctional DNA primase/polymerase [Pseudonocardiaceae bacterium]
MEWADSWHEAFRIELRAEAISLAWRGWPVLPGTYPTGACCGGGSDAGNGVPAPAQPDWADRLDSSPAERVTWWHGRPYTLLVATGLVLDVIEVSADLGWRTARALRLTDTPVPIAATPTGRWLFFTQSGTPLCEELAAHPDVVLHSTGSWVPLPPSPFPHGVVHWRVKPQVCGWQLPPSAQLQDVLCEVLRHRAVEAGQSLAVAGRSS